MSVVRINEFNHRDEETKTAAMYHKLNFAQVGAFCLVMSSGYRMLSL